MKCCISIMTAAIYVRVKSTCGVHNIFIVKIVWISRRWMSPHHECRLGFRPVIANNQRQLAWPKRGQLEKRQLEVKTAHEVAYARSTRFEHSTERDRHLPRRNKNAFQFQIDCQSLIIVIIICFLLLFRCCCCCCVAAAVVTITRFGVKYSCEFLSNWRPHNAFETPPPQDIFVARFSICFSCVFRPIAHGEVRA